VFGIQVKQRLLHQDSATSDWLIGEDIVGTELEWPDGRPSALRSMKDPGTANPHDDQPADMDGYVQGGDVHTNSGIPNRAFALVATTLGGNSWDVAGPIWYASLCDAALKPNASFAQFARLTVKHAQRTYGRTSKECEAVKGAWDTVKVDL
jgi:Zn-dependent metalloprotease